MIQLKQPNGWSCLPTAFASIVEEPVEDVFDYIGHNGSQILWPDLEEPMCRRSFHIQEMYAYCLSKNYAVTTFTPKFGTSVLNADPFIECNKWMDDLLSHYFGVMTGTSSQGNLHALAWDGTRFMDPQEGLMKDQEFLLSHFHVVTKII